METGPGAEPTRSQRIARLLLLAVRARLRDEDFAVAAERLGSSEPAVALNVQAMEAVLRANAGRRLHGSTKSVDFDRMKADLEEHTGAVAFLNQWSNARNSPLTTLLGEQNRLDWVNAVKKVVDKVIERERRIVLEEHSTDYGRAKGVHLLNLAFERRLKSIAENDTAWALKSLASPQRAAVQLMKELLDDVQVVVKAQQHLAHATQSRISAAEGDQKYVHEFKVDQRIFGLMQQAWSDVLSAPEALEALAQLKARRTTVVDAAEDVCRLADGSHVTIHRSA